MTQKWMLSCIVAVCVTLSFATAQNNIVASGGDATGSGGGVSYSVGQVFYIEQEGLDGKASQGLQQPYEFFTVGIEENNGIALKTLVYPNPTDSKVALRIEGNDLSNLTYQLFDLNGKLLFSEEINERETIIPMDRLPGATYLLKVINSNYELKSILIIKNL